MVLLHAHPLNAHAWDDFARAMATSFRVVAPDARGHGDSEWAASYQNDEMVSDLHALLEGLGLKDIVLCGNSMGASVAMAFTAQHPDRVDRLILVDTGPGPRPEAASTMGPPPAMGRPPMPPVGPFATIDDMRRQLPPWTAGIAAFLAEHNLNQQPDGAFAWKYDALGTAEGFARSMADPRRWAFWEAIACPTLVIRGGQSLGFPQAAAEEMVAANPHATLSVIPGAGHFVALEQPELFERAVRNWLAEHPISAAGRTPD
jgi:pimeloyl-ACP methyl ester carboxylesterase